MKGTAESMVVLEGSGEGGPVPRPGQTCAETAPCPIVGQEAEAVEPPAPCPGSWQAEGEGGPF